VSRYQKGKTNLDFTEARDSEWQWHQLGRMQVCTSLQTDNHANCPSCCPTNSVKALKVCSLEVVGSGLPEYHGTVTQKQSMLSMQWQRYITLETLSTMANSPDFMLTAATANLQYWH